MMLTIKAIVLITFIIIILILALGLGLGLGLKNNSITPITPTITITPTVTITPTDPKFTIVNNFMGADIIENVGPNGNFNFFTKSDPTHGYVDYGAWNDLLTIVDSTKLRIDMGDNKGTPRKSIRLESNTLFDTGLLVFDVEHVPSNISSWPAFWTFGIVDNPSTWALHGEIDILEQVNNSNVNSSTLHTNTPPGLEGCTMDPNLGFGSKSNCFALSGDKFCGFESKDFCPYIGCGKDMGSNTFGTQFNNELGGTFAMELTINGTITIWFWKRDEVVPDFSTVTSSDFSASNIISFSSCPQQFSKQQIIINTTLCGDWAGAGCCNGDHTWDNDAGCINWVNSHDLTDSYWIIRSLQLYKINY